MSVIEWIDIAYAFRNSRTKTDDNIFLSRFTNDARRIGESMMNHDSFPPSPEAIRKWSGAFAFLSCDEMDNWIWIFMGACLQNEREADVCVGLVPLYFIKHSYSLSRRFSLKELMHIREYFETMHSIRSFLLKKESEALLLINDSLELIKPKKDRTSDDDGPPER